MTMEKYSRSILLMLLFVASVYAVQKERVITHKSDSSMVIKDYRGNYSGYVTIENSTDNELYYIYLTHEDDTSWGEDLLGDNTLLSDESITVDLRGFPSGIIDLYAQDYDDNQYVFYGIDVSYQNLDITAADMDGQIATIGDTAITSQRGIYKGYVDVVNATGYDIFYLQYRHSAIDTLWSSDLLGIKTLYNKNSFTINISEFPTSLFDFRAEDEDGDLYTIENVDIEYDDLRFTLEDLDDQNGLYDTTLSGEVGEFTGDFIVQNFTGNYFFELYVMHSSENEWKNNLLEEFSLATKDSFSIALDNFQSSLFDIMAVDEDGNSYVFRNVDVAYRDVAIALNNIGEQGSGVNIGDTIITGMTSGFDGSIEISNQTGYSLYSVEVSLDDSREWGGNILPVEELEYDQSFTAIVINYPSNIFKIKATDTNGDSYTVRGYSASRDTLVISASDFDRRGVTIGSYMHTEQSGDFDGYVVVTNNTNAAFDQLRVSSSESSLRNRVNILRDVTMNRGHAFTIELEELPSPLVDITARTVDGDLFTVRNIDSEYEDLIISPEDLGDHLRDHNVGNVELVDSSGTFDGELRVVNRTGYRIHNLQLAESGKKGWGDNLIEQFPVIRSGKSFTVNLTGFSSSVFNVRVTDEDDDSYTSMKWDVKNGEVIFTVDDLD